MKALAAVALLLACCGCNSILFERQGPDGSIMRVSCSRIFWSTADYTAAFSTNGGSLKATKSSVDAAAFGAIAKGVAEGLAASAAP